MRLPLCLLAAATSALPLAVQAQTSTSRVVPDSRADQNPRTVRERRPAVAKPSRARARSTPLKPFTLRSVVVADSTVAPSLLEAAWRPFIGQSIDTAGLLKITDALAKVYERQGYAIYTVTVPDQTFENGVLKVRALEGYIDETVVDAPANPRDRALAEAYLAKLKAERPLRRETLERYVSLIRDIPGTENKLALENGAGDNGVRLKLGLRRHPIQFGLSVNNRGTAYLGRTQVQADVYLNGLLRSGSQTRLTAATPTDTKRFRSYAIAHSQPIGSDGLVASVNAGYLRTRPAGTDLLGHAKSAGAQLAYPLVRGYDRDVYLTLGVDGVDTDNAFLGYTFANDRTRAVRAAASFSQQSDKRLFYVSGSLSQGVDGLGARGNPDLGELNFRKLNVRGGASFTLGKAAALRVNAAGQYTGDRLPGTEQFAIGGDEFGRGYEASVIAGDRGYGALAELAYRPAKPPKALQGSELYAFADHGKVWYLGRYGAGAAHADLSSAGGGARLRLAGKAIVQLEAAKGLGNDLTFLDKRPWRGIVTIRTLW
jgi:hemolysin activation/secretion protein